MSDPMLVPSADELLGRAMRECQAKGAEIERLWSAIDDIEAWATTRPAPRRERLRQIRARIEAARAGRG